ncbi:hypothetical protein CEXT_371071 [Caerostris extrusa]|uniref:Uncharacterized protein n=1 Tax=Caerostris extrusa TaxID=172846 RepID=A0AAV4RJF2_CAEEX|nr:hypothetical protein CEXT_371071 [Caerostris extrusa]
MLFKSIPKTNNTNFNKLLFLIPSPAQQPPHEYSIETSLSLHMAKWNALFGTHSRITWVSLGTFQGDSSFSVDRSGERKTPLPQKKNAVAVLGLRGIDLFFIWSGASFGSFEEFPPPLQVSLGFAVAVFRFRWRYQISPLMIFIRI